MNNRQTLRIALVGNPNCGKSTLFNRLTGLRQKTSNLPGTTVDRKQGTWVTAGERVNLSDLPGIYSLYSESDDEKVVVRTLLGLEGELIPDKLLFVIDASNLRRNLLLFSQVAELGIPCAGVLTMNDTARAHGLETDLTGLSEKLGIPLCAVNPRTGEGIDQAEKIMGEARVPVFTVYPENSITKLRDFYQQGTGKGIAAETLSRYAAIEQVVKSTVQRKPGLVETLSRRLDKLFTHRILGFIFFFLIMLTLFQGVFTLAEYPMQWIEEGFAYLSSLTAEKLPPGWLNSLLAEGLIPGIAGVITFVPQIAILFFFIALLEDSGYMVRASFITDRIMRRIGLNGRSVIPLLGGFACAIPSIMATRTIRHKGERLATMFVIPLMSCSARLPVYSLLVGLAIPAASGTGPFSTRSLALTGAYFAGIAAAALISLFFRKRNQDSGQSEFILELPSYQLPRMQNVLLQMWQKAGSFITSAGKIIVLISIALWWLSSYGPGNAIEMAEADALRTNEKISGMTPARQEFALSAAKLEASYAGHMGRFIEPAIEPLGYDWKTGIALITSFAAREVFVGTMGTLFRSSGDDPAGIRETMQSAKDPETGQPLYGTPYALSLMVFYAFALQCMSTMAVMKRETGGWKWPLIQFFAFFVLAWISAFAVFNLSQL